MLNSLEIKNFRALEDFKVSKLGRVNLIVGKNNSGKSSILEALRIYAGGAQRELLLEIAGIHDETVWAYETKVDFEDTLPFESFFPGRRFPDKDNDIGILIGEIDRVDTALQIKYLQLITEEVSSVDGDGRPVTRTVRRLLEQGENVGMFDGEAEPVLSVIKGGRDSAPIRVLARLLGRSETRRIDPSLALLPCAMVPTQFVSVDELADIWDKVGLTSNKELVADALRVIAPDFQELMFIRSKAPQRLNERTAIVSLSSLSRPVPINSMGDGMVRILQLILKMFAAKGGILLIDEFENGLHFSVQEKVWQMMFDLAHKLDIQIFATTHSWDCIESFAQVAREREAGDGILFRVGRSIRTSDHGKITATVFDGQQLFDFTQADMEVR